MKSYTYAELAALKPKILGICERVAADNPTAWRQAHNGNFDDTSTRYNDLCVQELRKAGIYAGCNGKRGDRNSRSDDVLAFGLVAGQGGAQDRSGRFPEMAIIDFIQNAGDPSKAAVGWGDVSKAAPGYFLDPQGLPRIDGGGGGEQPVPPDPTPVPVDPVKDYSGDLGVIKAQVAALQGTVQALFSAQASVHGAVTSLTTDVHALIGQQVIATHLDDIKRRVDAVGARVGEIEGQRCRLRW